MTLLCDTTKASLSDKHQALNPSPNPIPGPKANPIPTPAEKDGARGGEARGMIRMLCMGRARHPGDRRLPHVRAMHHVFTAVKATCETLTNSPLQAKKTQARRLKRPDTVTRHLLDRFIGLANRWPANPPSEGQVCSAKPDPKDRTKVTSDSRPSPRKEADRLSTRRASDDARTGRSE